MARLVKNLALVKIGRGKMKLKLLNIITFVSMMYYVLILKVTGVLMYN